MRIDRLPSSQIKGMDLFPKLPSIDARLEPHTLPGKNSPILMSNLTDKEIAVNFLVLMAMVGGAGAYLDSTNQDHFDHNNDRSASYVTSTAKNPMSYDNISLQLSLLNRFEKIAADNFDGSFKPTPKNIAIQLATAYGKNDRSVKNGVTGLSEKLSIQWDSQGVGFAEKQKRLAALSINMAFDEKTGNWVQYYKNREYDKKTPGSKKVLAREFNFENDLQFSMHVVSSKIQLIKNALQGKDWAETKTAEELYGINEESKSENKLQKTVEAIAAIQLENSEEYDLALIAPSMDIQPAEVILLTEGAHLIMDASGKLVLGVAIPVRFNIAVILSVIPGAAADVTEDNYGLTPQQVAVLRGKGFHNAFFVNENQIVDAEGQVIAKFEDTDSNPKIFNSDEGGQAVNPNPDQFKPPTLPPDIQKVDQKFNIVRVRAEFTETYEKAHIARTSKIDDVKDNPPEFNYVKYFKVAVYDPATGKIYEGKWIENHDEVARLNGMNVPHDWELKPIPYISASTFQIKGTGVNIISIDQYNGFNLTSKDIVNLQNSGFRVMGPGFRWLVLNPNSPSGYSEIHSALLPK